MRVTNEKCSTGRDDDARLQAWSDRELAQDGARYGADRRSDDERRENARVQVRNTE